MRPEGLGFSHPRPEGRGTFYFRSQNPDLAYARRVAANVERELRILADAGVLVGWEEGMYV